ncbi:hypothetical protein PtrV1_13721 [Pyrenophora tritici-repentis]|nr:hypothetical protein PtrV1_13721 [Pyrenophora tritici-repentis]KAI1533566.1 repeatmulti-domain protein [Pyrenophora tritici-repentis]KAI1536132.1 repeatmulti-domain protein [Pyrenophora tritici-repentis]KAI1574157.1 repeatmulti-domain protein [Pyrenophora tritici-repentis]KAI1592704.1 repeatmulti-domain protein [Pyrenophora tritici-repentis]
MAVDDALELLDLILVGCNLGLKFGDGAAKAFSLLCDIGNLLVELSFALLANGVPLLGLGLAYLLNNDADHVLLKILLVLLQRLLAGLELLGALLVVLLKTPHMLILGSSNALGFVKVGFGVGELLLELGNLRLQVIRG